MNKRTSRWVLVLGGVLVVVGLPLAGHLARRNQEKHCDLDGGAIESVLRVHILDERGLDHEFCCIRCAEWWLARQPLKPRAVRVTDEASGREIEAMAAIFVRSSVVTTPTTGNRVHVFRTRADAEKHAGAFGGKILPDWEKPFASVSFAGEPPGSP